MLNKTDNEELNKFLEEYDSCWYNKDIERMKLFYPQNDDELIYFDNHKNNDTFSLNEHLKLINDFFQNGKNSESGAVEEIIKENVNCLLSENTACVCFYSRYKSFPDPAVRATMYLEKEAGNWKIKHVHCSFEPGK